MYVSFSDDIEANVDVAVTEVKSANVQLKDAVVLQVSILKFFWIRNFFAIFLNPYVPNCFYINDLNEAEWMRWLSWFFQRF